MDTSPNRPRSRRLILVAGLLTLTATQPSSGEDMHTIIARLRQAIHADAYSEHDGDWRLSGLHDENGVSGPATLQFDATGRFRRVVNHDLGTSDTFDGRRAWRTDIQGMPGPLDLSGLALTQLDVWIGTGVWLVAPDLIEVLAVDDETDSLEIRLVLRVRNSPLSGTLFVDRITALPIRLEVPGLSGMIIRTFTDYVDMQGIRVPSRVVRSLSGQTEARTTWSTLEAVPSDDASNSYDLTSLPAPPNDWRFAAPSEAVPVHVAPTGHLLVTPTLNDVPTAAFIFDTGAGQSGLQIDPPDSLGTHPVGEGLISSIFGVERTPILRGTRLQLGPLTLSTPVFMTMDFRPFEAAFGEPIGGIIGYDVLRRSIVEIDVSEPALTIHDPREFHLTRGTWMDLRFQDNHPIVSATVEGHTGLFRLDLGAAGGPHGNVVFNSPAVDALRLLDHRDTTEEQLGAQPVALGRIDSFELAGVRFRDLDVAFGLEGEGLFHDVYTLGNIGLAILSRFHIVFDYANARVALIPVDGG